MIKINNQILEASVLGQAVDSEWDYRESKSITCQMSYSEAINLFKENTPWSILYKNPNNEDFIEYDNSDFCLSGDITDHRNGFITIKMGKKTYSEILEAENARLMYENLTGEVY